MPACSSCPGVISFSTTVPSIGERISAFAALDLPALSDLFERRLVDAQRVELLEGRVAVGLGGDGVGLGLLQVAARDGVVLEELLVQLGDAPRCCGRRPPPCDRRRRRREIGRGDAREGLGLLDRDSHGDEQPRDRARDRREHLGGLVGVEGHGAGRLDRAAEVTTPRSSPRGSSRAAPRGGSECRRGPPGPAPCRLSRRMPRARAATPRTRRRPGGIYGSGASLPPEGALGIGAPTATSRSARASLAAPRASVYWLFASSRVLLASSSSREEVPPSE